MGSVARKGAAKVVEPPLETEKDAPSEVVEETPEEAEEARMRAERRETRQARTKQLRAEAKEAVQRGNLSEESAGPPNKRQRGRRRAPLPEGGPSPEAQDMERAVGRRDAPRYRQRLDRAEAAYEQGDYHKAWGALDGMAKDAPRVPEVRELTGLTLYRLGRWELAARELEAFRGLTGRLDLHPVLADCYRAQQRWADVDELWAELRASGESAAVLAEGRIVAAGALGDRGDINEAVQLLSADFQRPRRAEEHHLRQAYALADLYERAGEIPRARELFGWLVGQDELYVDVAERLASLR
ncbi:tetratricopeptide repeat protein [Candidatus Poriferisocius sp.]|uniref:tetratricopeptide repeat protein n=1 Tax=Candidatus Poriferisocius sp. TaxID=3101276 RepID=UPI003B016552